MNTPKSYDPECEVLAKHFLADYGCEPSDVRDLARALQYTVEDWFVAQTPPKQEVKKK